MPLVVVLLPAFCQRLMPLVVVLHPALWVQPRPPGNSPPPPSASELKARRRRQWPWLYRSAFQPSGTPCKTRNPQTPASECLLTLRNTVQSHNRQTAASECLPTLRDTVQALASRVDLIMGAHSRSCRLICPRSLGSSWEAVVDHPLSMRSACRLLTGLQASHGSQLQSLWTVPTAAVS